MMRHFKAEFFKTLAHPMRIRILDELREGELTVGQLQRALGAEQSHVSQHLAALRSKDFVQARRAGTSVWYSVSDAAIWRLLDAAREIYERQLHHQQEVLEATR